MKVDQNKLDKILQLEKSKAPLVNKLVLELYIEHGIHFSPTDCDLENVIFSRNGITRKLCRDIFFRYSGVSVMTKVDKKTGLEYFVKMTDEFFYKMQKNQTLMFFGINDFD